MKEIRHLYEALQQRFIKTNQLPLELDNSSVPMVYPYLTGNGEELKKNLIEGGIRSYLLAKRNGLDKTGQF
ncbi:MAG: hypothetical protein GX155_06420 [Smithella sp.]|jgi:allophanate hydrolase subunit 2|nr:hypothetical protein [Smithella sp.]